jgi:tryptophanyl-tRNA synthetase
VNERFREIRQVRQDLVNERGFLQEILDTGNERANAVAEATVSEVSTLMHTDYGSGRG